MLSQSQVLLIDSTRGLCKADGGVISLLRKAGVPILPVLTKADLLSPEELAKSHTIVQAQLDLASKNRPVGREQHELNVGAMISSHFLAGIENLWTLLDQRVLDQRVLEARRHEEIRRAVPWLWKWTKLSMKCNHPPV